MGAEEAAHALKRGRAAVFGRGAADYDQIGTPVSRIAGRQLVQLAGIGPGQRVLDVATGRGAVLFAAADAVGPSGRVLGVDLSPEMVQLTTAELRERGVAHASVRLGDAESLDEFGDGSFDCVTCAFAIFFLPEPARALRGFARVAGPGGTVALSSWGPPDPGYAWYGQLRERLGIASVSIETEPFESADELAGAMHAAGMSDVRVETEPMVFRLPSPEAWWRWVHTTAGRAALDAAPPEARERLREAAFERIAELYPGGVIELAESAIYAVGRGL